MRLEGQTFKLMQQECAVNGCELTRVVRGKEEHPCAYKHPNYKANLNVISMLLYKMVVSIK